MKKKILLNAMLVAMVALAITFQIVSAHQTVTVGDYQIEIGWVNEPPLVGQQNAVVVNVTKADNKSVQQPVEDVSGLTLSVEYGGENKILTLQPLGEDTPGQYVAPILPTVAGKYTVNVVGKLGDTDIKVQVQPEEVQAADTLEFPKSSQSQQQGTSLGLVGWLAIAGLVSGLAGLASSIVNMRKSR